MAGNSSSSDDRQQPIDWVTDRADHEDAMRRTIARVMESHRHGEDSILGDSADDIINDVFLQLRMSGNGPSNPNRLKAYLCTAAANATKTRLRRVRYDQPLPHESRLGLADPAASALLTTKRPNRRDTNHRDVGEGA